MADGSNMYSTQGKTPLTQTTKKKKNNFKIGLLDRSLGWSLRKKLEEAKKSLHFFLGSCQLHLTIDEIVCKHIETKTCHVWEFCKDLTFAHVRFKALCIFQTWIDPACQPNNFFNGFLSDSVGITLCGYNNTIIFL